MRFRFSMLNHFRSGSLNHILVCMHLKLSYCKFRKNESIKISLNSWSKDQMKITRIPMRCIFSLKLDQKQQKCLKILLFLQRSGKLQLGRLYNSLNPAPRFFAIWYNLRSTQLFQSSQETRGFGMAVAARLPKVAGAGKEYWGQNIYEVQGVL